MNAESLPKGTELTLREWATLNRSRSKAGRTTKNKERWGLSKTSECKFGEAVQDMELVLQNCSIGLK